MPNIASDLNEIGFVVSETWLKVSSRSSAVSPFDRPHVIYYKSSISRKPGVSTESPPDKA